MIPTSGRPWTVLHLARRLAAGSVVAIALLAQQGGCDGGCEAAGCSGTLCTDTSDELTESPCDWQAEYSCYKSAKPPCERQSNGACGWTETSALKDCLAAIKARRGTDCDSKNPCPDGLSCQESFADKSKSTCEG